MKSSSSIYFTAFVANVKKILIAYALRENNSGSTELARKSHNLCLTCFIVHCTFTARCIRREQFAPVWDILESLKAKIATLTIFVSSGGVCDEDA